MKVNGRHAMYITIPLILMGLLNACNSGSSSSSSPTVSYNKFFCPNTTNVSFPGVSGVREVESNSAQVYVTGVYVNRWRYM